MNHGVSMIGARFLIHYWGLQDLLPRHERLLLHFVWSYLSNEKWWGIEWSGDLCILRALALKLSVWVVVRYRNSLYRNSCNNIYVQANDHHAVLRCNMLLCRADHSEIRDSDHLRKYILNPQIFRCLLEVVIFVISSSKDISIPTVDGYWSYWEQETSFTQHGRLESVSLLCLPSPLLHVAVTDRQWLFCWDMFGDFLVLGGIIVPIMLPHLFTGDPFDIPVMRPEGWVGGGYWKFWRSWKIGPVVLSNKSLTCFLHVPVGTFLNL
jgi:hypothetical protein